ncbi:hypothetical protein P5V15_003622 [Pogonomyrmex californicus]
MTKTSWSRPKPEKKDQSRSVRFRSRSDRVRDFFFFFFDHSERGEVRPTKASQLEGSWKNKFFSRERERQTFSRRTGPGVGSKAPKIQNFVFQLFPSKGSSVGKPPAPLRTSQST